MKENSGKKEPAGRVPIEHMEEWMDEIRSLTKDEKDSEKILSNFGKHQYVENVKSALSEGLSFEQFFAETLTKIRNTHEHVEQTDIDDIRASLFTIWREVASKPKK